MVGFFAYAGLEYYESRNLIKGRALAIFLVIMAIFGVAAVFELVEWLYAEVAAPEAGADFLGSQGDIWDAQKDMLCDGTGAIFSSIIYLIVNRKK
jgi:putative membrane protein